MSEIGPKTVRTEQYEFEARTTDPSNAEPGEYWVRVDQTGSDPQVVAELRRQDTDGVTAIPLFDASEESNLGSDVVRGPSVVLDDGTVGFIAQTTDSGAEYGSPRVVTAAGAQYLSHDSLTLTTIPDSAVEQWTAAGYDGNNDEFIGQLNGFDLTGGSASVVTDGNGNTAVKYSGSSGQQHINSSIAVSYDRISLILVLNPDDTTTMIPWSDDTDSSVYGQLDDNGGARAQFGDTSGGDGSSGSSLALYLFDGQLVDGTPENILEENGTVLSTQTNGQSGFDGFMLGEWAGGGFDYDGLVYEVVVYQNASDEDLQNEKTRLKDKYAGLSF